MLDRSWKHAARIRHIVGVFARHGLGSMIDRLGLGGLIRQRSGTLADMTPSGVRAALEELGPTFVKLGQVLSMRTDIVPQKYASELAKLQDTAPTIPASEIHEVIREEFGKSAEDLYLTFNDKPVAAASLGQVHAATLFDGREVIVKIQRPGIRALIESDIEILYRFARFLEHRWDRARVYGLSELVDEFAILIREELDYTREARNTDLLRANLAECPEARLPEVYWDLTTPRVLTIERLHGIKITDTETLVSHGYDLMLIAERLASVFLKQIYVDGFFHADPHPGNILVMPDHVIGLVDCGQVGRLDASAKSGAIRLLVAFEHEDTRQFAETVEALGISQGDVDIKMLTRDLEKLLRHYYDIPARNVNVGAIIMRTFDVSAKHRVRLPSSFALLGKVLAGIDSISGRLNPDFNFTEAARPYVTKAVRQELNISNLGTDLYRTVMDLKGFLFRFPEYIDSIMRKMVEGSLRVDVRTEGIEYLGVKLDRAANRLSYALIIVGIIVGSSLVVVAGRGPSGWYGFPMMGIIGYIIATVIGLYLIIQIIRSGGLR